MLAMSATNSDPTYRNTASQLNINEEKTVITSEVTIDEQRCKGCGYCVQLCPRECLEIPGDKRNRYGYKVVVFTNAERCNTCGLCYQMCPHWAIDVSLGIETEGKVVTREEVIGTPELASHPPLANCSWCQHALVGRIVAEVLDELGVNGRAVPIEAFNCDSSSAFGMHLSRIVNRYERPCDVATLTKRTTPDAIVFLVLDAQDIATMADTFISALIRGEKFTMIMCTDVDCAPSHRHVPATLIAADEKREVTLYGYPVLAAELVATFRGVAYSARSAVISADTYQRTKSYIRTAFQKQIDNVGFSFVELLTVCAGFESELTAVDCLKQVSDRMAEWPLGEFKNVNQID